MLKVNDTYIQTGIDVIIDELKNQCMLNGIKLFYKSIDTPKNTEVLIC